MNDAEKATVAATLAAHEAILTTLLSRLLAQTPQEHLDALAREMEKGPQLKPEAPRDLDLDSADKLAGHGLEYHETMQRIYTEALALSGR